MLDKGLLDEFSNQHLKIIINNRLQGLNPQYAEVFLRKLETVYHTYLSVFPTQCAQLDLLWDLRKAGAITFENTIRAMDVLVGDMSKRFDKAYKPPKLFISHAQADSIIVKK